MQFVKASWLKLFNYGLIALTMAMFCVFLAFEHFQVSEATKSTWGITPSILVIGMLHLVYSFIIYHFIYKKFTWIANFIALVLYALLLVAVIETSGNTNVVYRLGYAALIFFMGMNGMFMPIAAIILTWTVFIFTYVGLTTPTHASIGFNILINIIVTAAGVLGWYTFKRWYVNKRDKETLALAGLLTQEQSKSNVILESITDGVIVMNSSGTVQVINESAATMLGWPQSEAVKLDYRSLIELSSSDSKIDSTETAIDIGLRSGNSEQKISYLKTRHGRQIYVDIVASPIFQTLVQSESGQQVKQHVGVIAVLRNVDEQQRQEQQRSDFISTASHEMRTPVAAIQGFIELALNPKVTNVDEKARGYLEKAHEATKHLGQLFQDLLTVSNSDDGRLSNKPELIEITEFLKGIVEQEQIAASKKELKLVFESKSVNDKNVSPLMYVNVDPERLREVMTNIVENSIKYTPSGIITVGVSLKEQGVVMRVSDTGMGIAEEDIPHLFQKFYRTDNTATREIGGTGLGLYICKQIIEMMGGRIWVESTLSAGSTFYVEIPRVPPESIQNIQQKQA